MRPVVHNSVERLLLLGLPLPILVMAMFAISQYGHGEFRDILFWPLMGMALPWIAWLAIGFPYCLTKLKEVPARVEGMTFLNAVWIASILLSIYSFSYREPSPYGWGDVVRELIAGSGVAVAMHMFFSFQAINSERKNRAV